MTVIVVIPARYASTRYPGKPLVELRGAGGEAKSLIRRSWDAAMSVSGVDRVVVATDDDRIKDHAEAFGAEVVMTSEDCQNGTERCAEAFDALGGEFDIVVNLQGDAPLTPAWFIEDLVAGLRADPVAEVATPVLRTEGAALNGLLEDRRAGRVGGTTAVFGANHNALYFSKEVIPFTGKHMQIRMIPRFSITSVSMHIAPVRWPPIPIGRPVRWSSWRGWNSFGSWNAVHMFYVLRLTPKAASSGN
jgi:3-deoxy-manno-octulosonate cytidylyltransferase (CMP-KDO synthetase)